MAKLFNEIDDWDSLESSSFTAISFKKVTNKKIEVKAEAKKKRKHRVDATITKSESGKYVKAPDYDQIHEKSKKTKNDEEKFKPQIKTVVSFQEKLKENLLGARFRFLNEQMYKTTGQEAFKLMREDDSAFEAYHEGYRHQILQWPMNPLDRIIKSINRLPKNYVIADFGCGDARLTKSVMQKVYSLDLVAGVKDVLECDMANTPLETKSINVVVFCLSLMGTNLADFFVEANRVLKIGGLIKIAEVSSRFDSIVNFIDFVQKCGFEVMNKDLTQNLFYFVNFKKCYDVNALNKKIPGYTLKPCLYKKR